MPSARLSSSLQVVNVRERVRDLGGDVQRDPLGHRDDVRSGTRHRTQGIQALDVLHRHELAAVDQAVVEDRHDAAVVHAAADPCLVEEHPPPLAVARVLGKQPLDRDTSFEASVAEGNGLDHLRHPTARHGSNEAITLGRIHGREC